MSIIESLILIAVEFSKGEISSLFLWIIPVRSFTLSDIFPSIIFKNIEPSNLIKEFVCSNGVITWVFSALKLMFVEASLSFFNLSGIFILINGIFIIDARTVGIISGRNVNVD